jgi:hypothetical protein
VFAFDGIYEFMIDVSIGHGGEPVVRQREPAASRRTALPPGIRMTRRAASENAAELLQNSCYQQASLLISGQNAWSGSTVLDE